MNTKSPKIVFFIYYKNLSVLGPYLYGAIEWQRLGYNVEIYSRWNGNNINNTINISDFSLKKFDIKTPPLINSFLFFVKGFAFIFTLFGMKTKPSKFASFANMMYFSFRLFFMHMNNDNTLIIATDIPSLITALLLHRRLNSKYVYFVREMFLSQDNKDIVDKLLKFLERKANKDALFTVEFDWTRANLVRLDNYLDNDKVRAMPNVPPGQAKNERSNYLREKFGILQEKKIVLYTGGIAEYNLTFEHIQSTETWPDNTILIMHCWGSDDEILRLKEYTRNFKKEIYFSTEMMPFNMIDELYRSADIGLAIYGDSTLNHKYAGLSSGKLFNFMKACVPTITNKTESNVKAIEINGCGICVNDISEVGSAISKILENENEFRQNCLKTFPLFSFEENYKKLIDEIITA